MSKYLSYAQFVKDRAAFRKAGTNSGDAFNIYDTASHKYFKILFYFGGSSNTNLSTNADGLTSGLLAPTWEIFKDTKNTDYYNYNSAWAYLKMNDENERADKLEHFVTLLSNISTYSPWYFSTVSGIQEALERKITEGGSADFGEQRKLSITCLPDAFDNRLTTLMELYRTITWSWSMKREILPANLRKFDMAIYIFESPINYWHEKDDTVRTQLGGSYTPSCKMLEFHNCEFDYNSIKSGWNEISNTEGFNPTYTIDISYDECYELSYNEFMIRQLGDIILTDLGQIESTIQNDDPAALEELKKRSNPFDKGFLGNAINQAIGLGKNYLEDKLERAVLGNLHTYSLPQIGSQIKSALQGNVISTVQAAKDYVNNAQQRAAEKIKAKPNGNIFKDITIVNNI